MVLRVLPRLFSQHRSHFPGEEMLTQRKFSLSAKDLTYIDPCPLKFSYVLLKPASSPVKPDNEQCGEDRKTGPAQRTMSKNILKEKVESLPELPGVYLFKDSAGRVIYIGKAKSLKKRVQSYFTRFLSDKTQALVAQIADVEYIISGSESQAQILEASLIKERQPKYNISLKDDKSFPWIRFSDERFPVVCICRRKKNDTKDSARYFGPYTNAKLLRRAFKVIRRIFGFRSCKKMPAQPCLYFRLNLCPGPCCGAIGEKDYGQLLQEIGMFLESKYEQLIDNLTVKMHAAARQKKFEDAARFRDQIFALSAMHRGADYFDSLTEHEDLRKLLKLGSPPQRIEAFDISNISGKDATGSMVSFYNGKPDKNNYRRFRIKTVQGVDDYAMMREVVRRRYSRLKAEGRAMPDAVVIDGGRQHLLAAQDELEKLGLTLALVAIAKEQENIYLKGRSDAVQLPSDSRALNLIRRIRDEAHRFARKYHHLLHRKKTLGED